MSTSDHGESAHPYGQDFGAPPSRAKSAEAAGRDAAIAVAAAELELAANEVQTAAAEWYRRPPGKHRDLDLADTIKEWIDAGQRFACVVRGGVPKWIGFREAGVNPHALNAHQRDGLACVVCAKGSLPEDGRDMRGMLPATVLDGCQTFVHDACTAGKLTDESGALTERGERGGAW